MDLHYNAFISYRHHPEDIKVAETIHRSLERYRVPKALKKEGKSIERIFRDKEELPITSSLTDTITMALRNSDYQIVICSTHLKGSYWVQREIETFLQTHTKDKILTVLVDGDNPYDVIPEILTYEEVVDPATGETFREPIEPLSCDWRLPKREAMKKELPRLAAVLLGCSYDDLIQRQKQYRQRRLLTGISIGMATSLALAGYFMYTSIQIQENLNQSLRNQSQYLASTAQEKFDSGDRLTAISLALAGLPQDGDRPYVAAAQRSLNNALMLYEDEGDLISVAAFDAESTINDFVVSDDGKLIYILDNQYTVTAWDTVTFQKLSTISLGGGRILSDVRMFTDNNGNLLTFGGANGTKLMSHSSNGTLLWQLDDIEDFVFCQGKNTVLALRRVDTDELYSVPESYELLHVDPVDGKLLKDPVIAFHYKDMSSPAFAADTYYEGQPIAFNGFKNNSNHILVFDPAAQTTRKLLTYDSFFYGGTATEDNLLYVQVTENEDVTNGRLSNYYFYTEACSYLYCFDMNTGKQKWRTDITSYNYSEANTVAPIPNSDRLFCQFGSAFLQIDTKTGEILAQCHSTNTPLTIQMRETSAWVLFNNGCAGSYTFASNQLGYIQYMENGLVMGHNNQGIYVLPQLSSTILLYRSTNDDSYEVFSGEYEDYIDQIRIHGDTLIYYGFGHLSSMDPTSRTLVWTKEIGYSYLLLNYNSDGTKLYLYKNKCVYELDVSTGDMTEWAPLASEEFNGYGLYYECVASNEDTFCCMMYPYGSTECFIVFADLVTQEVVMLPIGLDAKTTDWSAYGQTPVIWEVTNDHVLFFAGTSTLYRYDRAAQTTSLVTDRCVSDAVYLKDAENDRMYIRTTDGILITDSVGTEVGSIPMVDLFPVSMFRLDDLLLVLGSDGMVHRYDSEGNHLGRTALSVYSSFYSECNNIHYQNVPVTWAVTPDNELVVNVFRMGNIINMESWELTCDVAHLVIYHPETDSYICQSSDQFFAYKRLSLAETMELAKSVLNGFELSDEKKAYYGLS